MNDDTIQFIARVAFGSRGAVDAWFRDTIPCFREFAEIVTEIEREECAKLCENEKRDGEYQYNNAAQNCADSIRMRSNNKQKGSDQ